MGLQGAGFTPSVISSQHSPEDGGRVSPFTHQDTSPKVTIVEPGLRRVNLVLRPLLLTLLLSNDHGARTQLGRPVEASD